MLESPLFSFFVFLFPKASIHRRGHHKASPGLQKAIYLDQQPVFLVVGLLSKILMLEDENSFGCFTDENPSIYGKMVVYKPQI